MAQARTNVLFSASRPPALGMAASLAVVWWEQVAWRIQLGGAKWLPRFTCTCGQPES